MGESFYNILHRSINNDFKLALQTHNLYLRTESVACYRMQHGKIISALGFIKEKNIT